MSIRRRGAYVYVAAMLRWLTRASRSIVDGCLSPGANASGPDQHLCTHAWPYGLAMSDGHWSALVMMGPGAGRHNDGDGVKENKSRGKQFEFSHDVHVNEPESNRGTGRVRHPSPNGPRT